MIWCVGMVFSLQSSDGFGWDKLQQVCRELPVYSAAQKSQQSQSTFTSGPFPPTSVGRKGRIFFAKVI